MSGAGWCLSAAAAAAWAARAMDAERAMVWPVAPAPGDVFVLLHSRYNSNSKHTGQIRKEKPSVAHV